MEKKKWRNMDTVFIRNFNRNHPRIEWGGYVVCRNRKEAIEKLPDLVKEDFEKIKKLYPEFEWTLKLEKGVNDEPYAYITSNYYDTGDPCYERSVIYEEIGYHIYKKRVYV